MKHIVVSHKTRKVEEPNHCPHCHKHIAPTFDAVSSLENNVSDFGFGFVILWTCTYSYCGKLIATYNKSEGGGNPFYIKRFLNGTPSVPHWPKPIDSLMSGLNQEEPSKFKEIYFESLSAESAGLEHLAGIGFRKALEFLVKDWAIQSSPSDKEKIIKAPLAQVVARHFDGELKDILDRATWLGNDQAHYSKLHVDFDIRDLKDLIELLMVEFERDYKKAQYIGAIQRRT